MMEYFIAFTGGALWFIIYLIKQNSKAKQHIKQLKNPPKQDKIKQRQRERLIKQLMPLVNNNRAEAEKLADTPRDQTITINKRD